MPRTYPNQRSVIVHREAAKSDFLGIKNENWQAAARNLSPHSLLLYLYLAANANNYELALSAVAVREAIGMARSTYHDQFHILVDKGYLVPKHGNTYDFYEIPRPRTAAQDRDEKLSDGLDFDTCTPVGFSVEQDGHDIGLHKTEINNRKYSINNGLNIIDLDNLQEGESIVPKVKEMVVKRPKPEETETVQKPRKQEFVF